MSRLAKWAVAALFAAFVGWELIAAFDAATSTWPLTQVIVTYVPWPVTAIVITAFVAWLPWHFWIEYRRRARSRDRSDD